MWLDRGTAQAHTRMDTQARTRTYTHTHTHTRQAKCLSLEHGEILSATGTRTRVARVRAEYPNQLDYSGIGGRQTGHNMPHAHVRVQTDTLRTHDTTCIVGGHAAPRAPSCARPLRSNGARPCEYSARVRVLEAAGGGLVSDLPAPMLCLRTVVNALVRPRMPQSPFARCAYNARARETSATPRMWNT